MFKSCLVGSVFFTLLACSGAEGAPVAEGNTQAFWNLFQDGLAEVNGYHLIQPRYGELREGQAALIFIPEPFLRSTRVKADPGHPESAISYVLKLNLMKTFQTGIYPYRLLTSVFAYVDPEGDRPRGSLSKVTFGSQEWCGNVFHQMLFDEKKIRDQSFSYFDKEADQSNELSYPANALVGDGLWIDARGLFGIDLVARGEKRVFPFLPSLTEVRLLHKPLAWGSATVSRAAEPETISVPFGSFQVERYQIEPVGRATVTFYIETAYPHRIVRWDTSDGEKAELIGSRRLPYWQQHANQDQDLLESLGLSPAVPRN